MNAALAWSERMSETSGEYHTGSEEKDMEWETRVIISSNDGTSFIHNAIFDEALPVLKPSTFLVLTMLLARARNDPRLEVRASLADLSEYDGRSVLARNSVVTALRELRSLGMVAVDDTPDGSTTIHTYRLCDVTEWARETISQLLSKHEHFKDERSVIRNDANWPELRQQVLERDNYTCQYCGQQGGKIHCDHVIPVARGGTNDLSNLVTACERCNLSKNNRTPEEWQPC